MNLYEDQNIFTDIFENHFDKDKFSYFVRNLLNGNPNLSILHSCKAGSCKMIPYMQTFKINTNEI